MGSYDSYLLHTFQIPSTFPPRPKDFTSPNKTLQVCMCIYGINYRMEIHFFVFQ